MDEFEMVYYLDSRQVLLLLSLIDQRPVVGFPPIEEPEDWGPTALSLFQAGRLRCEGESLIMDETLSGLLLTMKDAKQVCAMYGRGPGFSSCTLYINDRFVLLEHLPGGKCRLHQAGEAEIRELLEKGLMCSHPMPEVLQSALEDDEAFEACLRRWEQRAVALEDSPARWRQFEEVRGVLEYQTPETKVRCVWIEDLIAGIILRQDQNGTHAKLDTVSQRRALLRELEMET